MKKGFTLIELLAVVIILGILATIVIPVTNNIIKNSENKAYKQQIENVRVAAKSWANENVFETPDTSNPTMIKTLNFLITNGYVNKNIVNPKTEEPFNNLEVYIVSKNGTLLYDIYENGILIDKDQNDLDGLPTITIKGSLLVYVNLNETYTDLGARAVNHNGEEISVTAIISKNNEVVDSVNTAETGTYLITYTAISGDISNSVVRTIIIK